MNSLDNAKYQMEQAAKKLNMSKDMINLLSLFERSVTVQFPVKMDNGSIQVFEGYRIVHNTSLGPAKGGIRYSPFVNSNECSALAMWMTWKSSILGLPFGGGKGGVKCDPYKLSSSEIERLTRRFATEITPFIGPDIDVPAPDLGTNEKTMAWIMDSYSMSKGKTVLPVVTGKPVILGGSEGRSEATARGILITSRKYLYTNPNHNNKDVVIQGFGNVGRNTAKLAKEYLLNVIAISDYKSAIYNPCGLDIPSVEKYYDENKTLEGYEDKSQKLKHISNQELLTLPCNLLIPCATENQITKNNAHNINAKIIIEGANGPITPEADEILMTRGIPIIPDVLANSGGVTVSYFEWVQDLQSFFWDKNKVNSELERMMKNAFDEVWNVSIQQKCSLRIAAQMVGIKRVANAMELRGIFP